jgi:MoxR-like ATPase
MIETKEQLERYRDTAGWIRGQIAEVIVGQRDVIEQLLWCLFAGGHALLEGIPGLGKTMLVRTIADTVDLSFSRIQFTPDLMPSDITGTQVIEFAPQGGAAYRFQQGPIFGNLVLADEINRATPKTQSALLEAMQEQTVTIGNTSYALPQPFFVLATQNPIENEGTYPLPEAQLDRFLLKIAVTYPSREELKEIIKRTTSAATPQAAKAADGATIIEIRQAAKQLLLAEDVLDYAVRLVMLTHPTEEEAPQSVKRYVRFGSGPRGLQAIIATSKVRALLHGRLQVSLHDIQETALPALRHRVLLSYEGQASGISPDAVIADALQALEKTS